MKLDPADRLSKTQRPSDFVDLGCQVEERTLMVTVYRGVCRICGWTSEPSDQPHSNTAHWATVRHIEQQHGYRAALAEPSGE